MKRALLDVLEDSIDTNDRYKVYTTDKNTCTGHIVEVGSDFVIVGRTVIAREEIVKAHLLSPEEVV